MGFHNSDGVEILRIKDLAPDQEKDFDEWGTYVRGYKVYAPIGENGALVEFASGEIKFDSGQVHWVKREKLKEIITADNWKSRSNKKRKVLRVFDVEE